MTAKSKGLSMLSIKKTLPISESVIIISFLIMLNFSDEIRRGALSGLVLTAGTILPSIFPFMILGDFLSCYISNAGLGFTEAPIRRIWGATREEISIAISGILCGFPSSARASAQAYKDGRLSEDAAITLSAFSSNPSPPFIIGALGIGLLGDKKHGLIFFLVLLFSIIITSLLFKKRQVKLTLSDTLPQKSFDFLYSVKNAGVASITVFSFVTLFCALIYLIKSLIGNGVVLCFISSALEVSTALSAIVKYESLPIYLKYMLIGFSIGFGGICANLQCAAFLSEVGLKTKKFFIIKLLLGCVSAALATVIFYFCHI